MADERISSVWSAFYIWYFINGGLHLYINAYMDGMSLSLKKQRSSDSCCNADGPWRDVMLSEISQMQNRHCYFRLVGPLEESGSLRQRTGSFVGTRAWGRGWVRLVF